MSFPRSTLQPSWKSWMIFAIGVMLVSVILLTMSGTSYSLSGFGAATIASSSSTTSTSRSQCLSSVDVDLNWYPPAQTMINNLSTVLDGSGVYGFIFNSSSTPPELSYSTYNWCNMPHVRAKEYQVPDEDYQLEYVELVRCYAQNTSLPQTD